MSARAEIDAARSEIEKATSGVGEEIGIPALSEEQALALIAAAEHDLGQIHDAKAANVLRRKIGAYEYAMRKALLEKEIILPMVRLRLRAWDRWGEMLGRAENQGKRTDLLDDQTSSTATERFDMHRARKIHYEVPRVAFEALLAEENLDKLTLAAALRLVPRPDRDPVAPPAGQYSILYADPPWQYDHNETPDMRGIDTVRPGEDAERHYPTMAVEAIEALFDVERGDETVREVPAADDAVLFLWATNPKLIEAFRVMEAWGFEYRTNAVWVKDRIGQGYYVRGQHELLLIGRRGEFPPPKPENRFPSVLSAPRGAHSEKPVEVYELIESMYPGQTEESRIELFARKQRPGWETWPPKRYELLP